MSDQKSGTWISRMSPIAPRTGGASASKSRRASAVTEPKR
jgi:hypothetical protein